MNDLLLGGELEDGLDLRRRRGVRLVVLARVFSVSDDSVSVVEKDRQSGKQVLILFTMSDSGKGE